GHYDFMEEVLQKVSKISDLQQENLPDLISFAGVSGPSGPWILARIRSRLGAMSSLEFDTIREPLRGILKQPALSESDWLPLAKRMLELAEQCGCKESEVEWLQANAADRFDQHREELGVV